MAADQSNRIMLPATLGSSGLKIKLGAPFACWVCSCRFEKSANFFVRSVLGAPRSPGRAFTCTSERAGGRELGRLRLWISEQSFDADKETAYVSAYRWTAGNTAPRPATSKAERRAASHGSRPWPRTRWRDARCKADDGTWLRLSSIRAGGCAQWRAANGYSGRGPGSRSAAVNPKRFSDSCHVVHFTFVCVLFLVLMYHCFKYTLHPAFHPWHGLVSRFLPPHPEYSEYKHHMFHMRSLSISWQTGHYVCTLLTLDPDSCSLAVQACSSAKWCISKTNLAMATRALHLWSNKKLSLVSLWKFGGRHGDCDSCYSLAKRQDERWRPRMTFI